MEKNKGKKNYGFYHVRNNNDSILDCAKLVNQDLHRGYASAMKKCTYVVSKI